MVDFTYWRNGEFFIGFLNEFPDYETQGMSFEELTENLKDIYHDVTENSIPFVRKTMSLSV